MKRIVLWVLPMLLLVPRGASASSIDFLGMGAADVVHIQGVRDIWAWAGEMRWQWMSGQPTGWDDFFYTYCVDVLHNETDPQQVTVGSISAMPTVTLNGGAKAAWLFNTYADAVHASGDTHSAAGLQLAIWEVLYDNAALDGSFSLGSGSFFVGSAPGAALTAGQGYLNGLTATGLGYSSSTAAWLDAPGELNSVRGGQDQITHHPVPEPGSLMLFGSGCLALAARFRKRAASR